MGQKGVLYESGLIQTDLNLELIRTAKPRKYHSKVYLLYFLVQRHKVSKLGCQTVGFYVCCTFPAQAVTVAGSKC